jgi:hypothetical protein
MDSGGRAPCYFAQKEYMFRYLIQVIQNSLGTAGLAALLFLASNKEGGENRKPWMLWAGIAGAAAALILAVLRRTTALVNRSIVNAYTLAAALIAGAAFLLLYRGGKRFSRLRPVLYDPAAALLTALLLFYTLPTVFLYPTEFLLAGESFLSTDFLFKLIGFLAGLLIVLLCAFALFEVGKALPDSLIRCPDHLPPRKYGQPNNGDLPVPAGPPDHPHDPLAFQNRRGPAEP